MQYLMTVLFLLPFMVAGDLLWLGVFMKDFYRAHLGHLMAPAISWTPAVLFYILYSSAIVYFAVAPHAAIGLGRTVLMSALLGAFAYATYDLTNHATLRDWPAVVTVVDIAWGAVLSGCLGALGYMVWNYFS